MIEPDGPCATREGLITAIVLPHHDAQQAFLLLLPHIPEAIRLRDQVVAVIGDRLVPTGYRMLTEFATAS